jgi:argininosuccinate lyase
VVDYTSSLESDERIFGADLLVNYAHVTMLTTKKIITLGHGAKILRGLREIESLGFKEIKNQKESEDIHAAIESKLIDMLSEDVGGRIHTGRSRNDEVATCIRMILRKKILDILKVLINLQRSILKRASEELTTIMPGYTHGQIAQPVTFGHYLLAHVCALTRDTQRLLQAYGRVNQSPLGAGALATTSFPIDRYLTARLLGFDGLMMNSIDAVGSRDFILEILSALSILASNTSRLEEDLILWNSTEYGMIEISDGYSSTSSIMPQKKNPDTLELARAKTGRIYGDLLATLTMLKGLPLAYNRDLQEVTPRLWDGVDEIESTLEILVGVVSSLKVKRDIMTSRVMQTYATATELADTLVREKNLPFRTAHMLVGALVRKALNNNIPPAQVKAKDLDQIAQRLIGRTVGLSDSQITYALNPEEFIRKRKIFGGPNMDRVGKMIGTSSKNLDELDRNISGKSKKLQNAEQSLRKQIQILTS